MFTKFELVKECFKYVFFSIDFREKGKERMRERNDVKEKIQLPPYMLQLWGRNLQSGNVPSPGIDWWLFGAREDTQPTEPHWLALN